MAPSKEDWLDQFAATQKGALPGLTLWANRNDANMVVLTNIRIPVKDRGQGNANRIMQAMCALADEHGDTIVLTPAPDFGARVSRLVRWYRKLGFTDNRGANKDWRTRETMIRLPRENGHVVFRFRPHDICLLADHPGLWRVIDVPGETATVVHLLGPTPQQITHVPVGSLRATVATLAERKLGNKQKEVLAKLREQRAWPAAWHYGSPSHTRNMLNTLVRRGLVAVDAGVYTPVIPAALPEYGKGGG